MSIVTRYSHCWGILDDLATLGTVNVQIVQVWRHVSNITTYGWCNGEVDDRRHKSHCKSIPGLRPISSRTVRNILRDHHIRPWRPAIRPILLSRHRAARLTWCRHHLRFRRQDWANILFTNESLFHLDSSDDRSRVYRRVGKCYADACVIQRRSFGEGSVMVKGGITKRDRTPFY